MTNITFAIPAEAAATPENPKAAEIIAITKNITAHVNIISSFGQVIKFELQLSYR